MLDECPLEGWMLAPINPRITQLTKDTDGEVLGHRARLDGHIAVGQLI